MIGGLPSPKVTQAAQCFRNIEICPKKSTPVRAKKIALFSNFTHWDITGKISSLKTDRA